MAGPIPDQGGPSSGYLGMLLMQKIVALIETHRDS